MKSGVSPPREICWGPTILLQQTKKKKTERKSKYAPRKMHNA
jgi:hypothetical protein